MSLPAAVSAARAAIEPARLASDRGAARMPATQMSVARRGADIAVAPQAWASP